MNSPNNAIPYVPEGTLDPAAGLNLAIDVIDALLQASVVRLDLTAPPGTNSDGDRYIVASPATGDWTGEENNLARYRSEGDFWEFFTAGEQANLVLNLDDFQLYAFDAAASPPQWVSVLGGGGSAESGRGDLTVLTIGSNTINIDHEAGADFDLELTANVATVNHNNVGTGLANWFTMRIRQDGVGGRTFTPPASWVYPSGVAAYTVSAGAGDIDVIQGVSYNDGTTWLITYSQDFT